MNWIYHQRTNEGRKEWINELMNESNRIESIIEESNRIESNLRIESNQIIEYRKSTIILLSLIATFVVDLHNWYCSKILWLFMGYRQWTRQAIFTLPRRKTKFGFNGLASAIRWSLYDSGIYKRNYNSDFRDWK